MDEIFSLKQLDTTEKIQCYLNSIEYDERPKTSSPLMVLREKKANCFEGALLAAACLMELGYPPLIVDMIAENDDDHVIAVFKKYGHWGAIAKSNFSTLKYREPVYRSTRELIMSYFDVYFNTLGEKSLRKYSRVFSLKRYKTAWISTSENLDYIGSDLEATTHYNILSSQMRRSLIKVDKVLYDAGFLGSKPEGLYKAS